MVLNIFKLHSVFIKGTHIRFGIFFFSKDVNNRLPAKFSEELKSLPEIQVGILERILIISSKKITKTKVSKICYLFDFTLISLLPTAL